MTSPTPPPATDFDAAIREAVEEAAHWSPQAYYSDTLRAEAARALARVYAVLEGYGVDADVRKRLRWLADRDAFAAKVLEAIVTAQHQASRQLELDDSGKTDLLNWIVAGLGPKLGAHAPQGLTIVEPPTIVEADPTDPRARAIGRAYMVLGRLETTPPWGPDGTAPLVVALDRADGQKDKPWAWDLYPDAGPYGTGQTLSVIAPAPSLQVATEVGDIVAQVLRGDRLLQR